MIPLPAPVGGVPFDLQTDAGRVSADALGAGRTVLLLHSFTAAGAGIELAALASRLADQRRVVLVDWPGFGTSDRPDVPSGWQRPVETAVVIDRFPAPRLTRE